jgi:Fe2+ transport system protein FeoA
VKLSWTRAGDRVTVTAIEAGAFRVQALRLGITPGATLLVTRVLADGPVVVRVADADVTVGRALADAVEVARLGRG